MDKYDERELEAKRIDEMYEEVEDAIIALLVSAWAVGTEERVHAAATMSKQMLYEAYRETQVWNQEAVSTLYGERVEFSPVVIDGIIESSDARFYSMTETASRRIDDLVASFDQAEARRRALMSFQNENWAMSTESLARALEDKLRDGGITSFTDAAGRKWKLTTYAEMAARTTTMEAQNAGVKDHVIAAGGDLVQIVGPLDYPDGCPPAVLNGPYSITGATKTYEGRDIMTLDAAVQFYGVFHPRCRHSLFGWS